MTVRPPVGPWPTVRELVRDVAAAPGPLLVVTDFDGTLARVSPDPMAAAIEPLGRSALRRLARIAAARPARLSVVVLSGRTVLDLVARVRVGGVAYLGDHGLQEGLLDRGGRVACLSVAAYSALAGTTALARDVGAAVARELGSPGWLYVEDKGPSVAFHFRAAADPDAAGRSVEAVLDRVLGPETGRVRLTRFRGRRIVELRPVGAGGKGSAVTALLASRRFAAAIVLGDDRSDAEAFAAIADARAAGRLPRGLALAVHGAYETPPEIVERADGFLATPRDAARVLSLVARTLEAEAG